MMTPLRPLYGRILEQRARDRPCARPRRRGPAPSAMPVPITATPIPLMTVFTSAKSRLMRPGTRIRSEMPWIAWRSTSSASANAWRRLTPRFIASSRSFGIVMTLSTASRRSARPRSACFIRRPPSKTNGLVTTAMVSAPISLARLAMTGAAPVPVPPPMPAVTKTMSAPSSTSSSRSVSSSAAARPDDRIGAGAEALGQLLARAAP